jgi:Zn-dependent M28 family amino/carboxypeptidase
VRLDVRTTSEQRLTRNVLAETDRPARVAMAGAHLDSVEEGPGLNDNGSGIAALLEVRRALADRPACAWASGRRGGGPLRLAPLRAVAGPDERRRLAAYLNLDMVGSPNPRRMVYDTDDRIEDVLREEIPGDEGETNLGGASDHAPFDSAGIAVGGIFTGAQDRVDGKAADPCYHRACDDLDNVDAQTAAVLAAAAQRALPRLRSDARGG